MNNIEDKDVSWTKDMVTNLLDSLEQYPCLYDTKNKFYRNKHSRRDALFKISNYIKENLQVSVSVEQIKKKIANIRTQLAREIFKENSTKKSGAGADEIDVDHIWWFEKALFITPHIQSRKGKSTINIPESPISVNETQDTIDMLSDEENLQSSIATLQLPRSKKRKIADTGNDDIIQKTVQTLENLNKQFPQTSNSTQNQHTLFGQLVAEELAQIDDQMLVADARFEIQNILYTYKKKCNYDNNTTGNVALLKKYAVIEKMLKLKKENNTP